MACDIVNEEMQRTNNSIYFRATNYARGGTDTSDATGILPQMLSRAPIKPDIIFIDFSVNDIHSIQNRPGAPSPSMPAEVLLDLVAMISPKSVVIFVIVGTFYINTPWLLRWHFARLRLLCSMRQVPIVDFRFACTATSHCLWTGSDVREYHPLYRVHRGMAETIADGLLRTFRRSVCLEGDLQEDFSEETHTLFTKEEKKELMRCVSPAHDISGYDPPSPWAINATAGGWSLLVERNVPAWTTTTVGANLSFNVRMADKAPLMIAVSSLCSYENAGIVKMHFPTDRKRPYPVATIDTHWADRFSGHCISWFLVSGGHRYLWGHQAQPGTVVPVVFEFVGARKEHVTRQAFFKLFSITSC
jgi:hypothetical protein